MRIPVAELVPRSFRIVHLIWAILILAGCVVLVTMGGGHPPPMVLVPPLLAVGILGHLLLVFIAWLLGKGRARFAAAKVAAPKWPPELVMIAVVLGLLAIGSIAITIAQYGQFLREPLALLLLIAIAAGHTVAFVLLVLRSGAARFLIAAIALGWGLALVLQIGEARPGELPIAIALIGALMGIAVYVLRAKRIRSVLR